MNKFLFASLALLCLSSCSTEELIFTDNIESTYEQTVSLRASEIMNISYTDTTGTSQSTDCTEISLSYISSSTVEIVLTFDDGTTQTDQGNDFTVLPINTTLLVTTSPTNGFTTDDFNLATCRDECCYNYNAGNNAGTGLSFIVEEEPNGF